MELKHGRNILLNKVPKLLIVPYGIETTLAGRRLDLIDLLIVPYGIETTNVYSAY